MVSSEPDSDSSVIAVGDCSLPAFFEVAVCVAYATDRNQWLTAFRWVVLVTVKMAVEPPVTIFAGRVLVSAPLMHPSPVHLNIDIFWRIRLPHFHSSIKTHCVSRFATFRDTRLIYTDLSVNGVFWTWFWFVCNRRCWRHCFVPTATASRSCCHRVGLPLIVAILAPQQLPLGDTLSLWTSLLNRP